MKKSFDIPQYLNGLAKDLVNAFDKAGNASHASAVGSGREKGVRNQLELLLPAGLGVGSGFVIDSYGNISKQCDVIIYEKEYALKFCHNDDDLYSYYNCENVLAVGQVKSKASIEEVGDAIENLKSVKVLKRFEEYDNSFGEKLSSFRHYLMTSSFSPAKIEEYNPILNSYDNIFTFLICDSFLTPSTSIVDKIEKICEYNTRLYPNRMVSVRNDYCHWIDEQNGNLYNCDPMKANRFSMQSVDCALGYLIFDLLQFIKCGRSVPNNKSVYFPQYNTIPITTPLCVLKNSDN